MNEQGHFTAALIDSAARAFAAGAAGRMRDARGHPTGLLELWSFEAVVADMEVRLRNLSEALAVGRPEVFELDVRWLLDSYAARGVSVELVRNSLVCLRAELRENLPAQGLQLCEACIDLAIGQINGPPPPPACHFESDRPHAQLAREFLLAVLEGRSAQAHAMLLEATLSGLDEFELGHYVITPAQAEMGLMWQRGEVTTADEHLGSRIVESAVAVLHARHPAAAPVGRTVIIASVSGNLHDIGARLVSNAFESAGWRSIFLGADMPAADLVRAAEHHSAQLVALSVGLGRELRATARTIAELKAGPAPVSVLVGGYPFAAIPDLWRDVGADGTAADTAGALREGTRLVERRT